MGILKKKKQEAINTAKELATQGFTPKYSDDGKTFTMVVAGDPNAAPIRTDALLQQGQSGLFHLKKKRATKAFELMAQQGAIEQARQRAATEAERIAAERAEAARRAAEEKNKNLNGGCPAGTKPDGKGNCLKESTVAGGGDCPEGQEPDGKGGCKKKSTTCPDGQEPDGKGGCKEKVTSPKKEDDTKQTGPMYLSNDQIFDATDSWGDFFVNGLYNFVDADRSVTEGMLEDAVKSGKPYMEVNGQIINTAETLKNIKAGRDLDEAVVEAKYGKLSMDKFVDRFNKFKSLEDAMNFNYGADNLKEGQRNQRYEILVGDGDDARLYWVQNGKLLDPNGVKPYIIEEQEGLGKNRYIARLGSENTQNRGEVISPTTAAIAGTAIGLSLLTKSKAGKKIASKFLNPSRKVGQTIVEGKGFTGPLRRTYTKNPGLKPKITTTSSLVEGKGFTGPLKQGYAKNPGLKPKLVGNKVIKSEGFAGPLKPRTSVGNIYKVGLKPKVVGPRLTPGGSYVGPIKQKRVISGLTPTGLKPKVVGEPLPSVGETIKYWWNRPKSYSTIYRTPWQWAKTGAKAGYNFAKEHPYWTAGGLLGAGTLANTAFKDGGKLQRPTKRQFGGILFK